MARGDDGPRDRGTRGSRGSDPFHLAEVLDIGRPRRPGPPAAAPPAPEPPAFGRPTPGPATSRRPAERPAAESPTARRRPVTRDIGAVEDRRRRERIRPRVDNRRRVVPAGPPKLVDTTRRLRSGTVLAIALFLIIGLRLVVLQIASSPEDAAQLLKVRDQRISSITLPAARGSILDRNGTILAHSVEARYVAADPMLVKDPEATATTLAPLLGVARSKLVAKMTRHQRADGRESQFEFLAQGVDVSAGTRIAALGLDGIVVRRDERRDVTGADLAANLIGFTGADNSGLEGLEARYDSVLRGTPGKQEYEIGRGKLDKPIPGGYQSYTAPKPGSSLVLTIDSALQYEVLQMLGEQLRDWKATIGGAVVIDVRTGEVLAQASYPSYNAAEPLTSSPADRMDVPSAIVADPGSVHKAFMFGAALQEGVITPDTVLRIGPSVTRGGVPFPDSHPQAPDTPMTMPGLLALSSDVGTIKIADELGKDRVYDYQRRFGLGQAAGEGVAGEAAGRVLTPDQWSPSASGSVPIGMSVDATLVQMAAGYAAIANDGTYIQPHLIKATIAADGTRTQAPAPATHQVLTPAVAAELRTMMEAVVDDKDATGTQARVTGYRVAGKTGTGQRLVDGKYLTSKYGSFIGMAPAENPRYVIAVSAEVAHGSGGDVAAPAFSRMMSYTLLHYRVPPTSTQAPVFRIHP